MEPQWERLGQEVLQYRLRRGWSQAAVNKRGGPSDTLQTKIESGKWRPTRGVDDTLRKIDTGLEWVPGSASRVLAGGEPSYRLTRDDLRRPPGPLTAEDTERQDVIEQALADADLRRDEHDQRRRRPSSLFTLLEARRTPPEERTPEHWEAIRNNETRRTRADRAVNEAPLVDLVVDGQDLAAAKDDADVSAYVRKVESTVVGIIGVDRLTDALDGRVMERDMSRAARAGVVKPLMDEIDRMRSHGVEGRALLRAVSEWLDRTLSGASQEQAKLDITFDPAAGSGAMLGEAAREVQRDHTAKLSEGRRLREEQDLAAERPDTGHE